jgi:hypothetical protein
MYSAVMYSAGGEKVERGMGKEEEAGEGEGRATTHVLDTWPAHILHVEIFIPSIQPWRGSFAVSRVRVLCGPRGFVMVGAARRLVVVVVELVEVMFCKANRRFGFIVMTDGSGCG